MSKFDDFQRYEHVAEAHFKANEAICLFFRYYLLVMSLPLPVLGVLFGLIGRNGNFERIALSLLGLASPAACGARKLDAERLCGPTSTNPKGRMKPGLETG